MKAFEARAKRTGVKAKPMTERPKLLRGDLPYWEAFLILSQARQSGMGVNPLMVSEILSLVRMGGVDIPGDLSQYLRLVQRMDSTFLEHMAEKSQQKNSK